MLFPDRVAWRWWGKWRGEWCDYGQSGSLAGDWYVYYNDVTMPVTNTTLFESIISLLELTLWLWVRLLALRCHRQQHRHIDCLLAYIFTNCLDLGSASLEHTQSSDLALIRYFEKLKSIETLSLWINFHPRCFPSKYAQTLRLFLCTFSSIQYTQYSSCTASLIADTGISMIWCAWIIYSDHFFLIHQNSSVMNVCCNTNFHNTASILLKAVKNIDNRLWKSGLMFRT